MLRRLPLRPLSSASGARVVEQQDHQDQQQRLAGQLAKDEPDLPPVRRKLSFLATMKAVFWSFFGVRKRSDHEKDIATLNPVFVIVAGLLGALIFIGVLIGIVRMVVAQ